MVLDGWTGGWVGGCVYGWWSWVKDCLQQSKKLDQPYQKWLYYYLCSKNLVSAPYKPGPGWMDGWVDGRAGLRIAYTNQK